MWLTEADQEVFCTYIPHVQEDPIEEDPIEEDPIVEEPIEEDPIEDEEYVPPPAVKTGGRTKAPLSPALDRTTLDKRVDDLIPTLQNIAEAENTGLIILLLIVLAKLCGRFGWKSLAKLL